MALLIPGQCLHNTYEVERFLGEGAFAEVYRVKHRFLGRQAMKIFKLHGLTLKELETKLHEAVILSRVGHPNVVRVFDANVTELNGQKFGYYTMEYVAGGSLEKYWKSYGNSFIPIETTVDILRQTCRGLAVAHQSSPPIVHRDIKPQNLLVGYDVDGIRVRVSDFGLAKHVNPLTLLASAQGTICFKSPEVFSDYHSDSCAGDVWALGCTAYMLLTDRFPLPHLDDLPVIHPSDFTVPILPPSEINCFVDTHLEKIVMRCLAMNVQERYQNAAELLKELEKWRPYDYERANVPGSFTSKDSFVNTTPPDPQLGQSLAKKALELSLLSGRLAEAADLMEEAFRHSSQLRDQHEYQVRLWRRGIMQ